MYYDFIDYSSDDNDELSEERKELEKYTLEDYLKCDETKEILNSDHYLEFENNLSDNILGLYENFCLDKQEQSSNILSNENNTYNNSELISLVYKHLVKD